MAGTRTVIGGVDTHADTHHAAVIDDRGRLLGVDAFPATGQGYEQMLAWMHSLGTVVQVASRAPEATVRV
jgi:hypothetical protein